MEEHLTALSDKKIKLVSFVILCFYPLIGMGVDLISPSLPAISLALHVSSTLSKNLIAIYLLAYAIANFIVGFLSDALGRRKLMIVGFLLFTFVSLLPTFFPNIVVLWVTRFLQGVAFAFVGVVARAIFVDILSPRQLLSFSPVVNAMWGIGPIIGPVIGGYLQHYFNWQACFYFFSIMGAIDLVLVVLMVPETHFKRQALNIKQARDNFVVIIKDYYFVGLSAIMGLVYSLLIVFSTLGPFLIQKVLGHSPVYFGHVAFWMGVTFLAGTIFCRQLIKKQGTEPILRNAIPIFLFIASLGLVATYFSDKSLFSIILLSLFMFLGVGIIYPPSMGQGLTRFRHLAGSSNAIMNLINLLLTSIVAFAMGFISDANALPMAWIYFLLMLFSMAAYFLLLRPKQ